MLITVRIIVAFVTINGTALSTVPALIAAANPALVALAVLCNAAFDADPAQGWQAFIERYQEGLDAGDG